MILKRKYNILSVYMILKRKYNIYQCNMVLKMKYNILSVYMILRGSIIYYQCNMVLSGIYLTVCHVFTDARSESDIGYCYLQWSSSKHNTHTLTHANKFKLLSHVNPRCQD